MLAAGDVLLVNCQFIKPPHDKFVVCLCPEEKLFFFINTRPRQLADAQVQVREFEVGCLSHDSYVDTSKVVTFSQRELQTLREQETLSNALKLRIKTAVRKHPHLAKRYVDLVEQNF